MHSPLQQSQSWQHFLNQLGAQTFFLKGSGFSCLAELKSTPLGPYLYVPYGPYTTAKTSLQATYQALQDLAKAQNALFIRVEPQSSSHLPILQKLSATKSHDLNPADTWVLDLSPSQSQLLSGMTQGTRTRYNQFSKKGLTVNSSQNPADIQHLVRLQQKLAHHKNFATFSSDYLKSELAQDFATLYLVHYTPEGNSSSQVIAASLFFDYQSTRYYMQSAADPAYKKLPATVALLSTALFDAKAKGLKTFDFWGIAPEHASTSHPWAGFTNFKKSFGGHSIHYCGTWDIICQPTKYRLYQALRHFNRFLRKIK